MPDPTSARITALVLLQVPQCALAGLPAQTVPCYSYRAGVRTQLAFFSLQCGFSRLVCSLAGKSHEKRMCPVDAVTRRFVLHSGGDGKFWHVLASRSNE